jgi:nitrate reductase alpha subunit
VTDAHGGHDQGNARMAALLPGGEPVEQLLRGAQFFTPGTPSQDYRELHRRGGRGAEEFYRARWRHDKEVRSTHGVNCTGSCSWKVYVKDGIITWETQQTDYPSVGPDSPEYEPRGCPRGASFSWYTYSPSRVRYPYVRGPLLEVWREAAVLQPGHGRGTRHGRGRAARHPGLAPGRRARPGPHVPGR